MEPRGRLGPGAVRARVRTCPSRISGHPFDLPPRQDVVVEAEAERSIMGGRIAQPTSSTERATPPFASAAAGLPRHWCPIATAGWCPIATDWEPVEGAQVCAMGRGSCRRET